MSTAVQLPAWAAYMAAIGAPVGAFTGGLIGQVVTRKGAWELEKRSRREEVLRTLRWAAELAINDDESKAALGLSQLEALADSNLSDLDVQAFVDAALDAVVGDVADEVEDDPEAEIEPVPTIRIAGIQPSARDAESAPYSVQSAQEPSDGGDGQ